MQDKAAKAVDYLEKILKAFKLEGQISQEETEDGLMLEVTGQDMGLLIGREGQTLDAIEFIVSLIANKGEEERQRIHIDVEGYKKKKKLKIEQMALDAAKKVEEENESVALGPMTPYERRIVHLTLRENTAVRTESEGEDPARRVTIKPL